ncbi:iron-sulfur assembly mitochondrial [Blastocystis sp. subtype 4]|uniref:iron-sulfur assembly mitochondrial n=1 Tax=Blastocystis sp. subtype 4 TaxID=944170 RepID=UPI000711AF2B|nr:iron-sulfur assembly mitochondrial [Blastocystis sp. subtype 4]KNB42655.1 iron-sulfur assembly mitochondrial [Blastocystis sp. subtype 4]|eukprot:XP_014526098.1 iron-sulfur assembly mitochondrial [Blastocystis sp. subtype 4]
MYRSIIAVRSLVSISSLPYSRSFAKVINSGAKEATRTLKGATQAVSLTKAAEDRVRELLSKKPQGTGLLLSTTTSPFWYCAPGQEGPFDEVIEQNGMDGGFVSLTGVKVVVDADSLMYILGTKIDYKEDDISAEFVFDNPLATSTCGCGESFSTK